MAICALLSDGYAEKHLLQKNLLKLYNLWHQKIVDTILKQFSGGAYVANRVDRVISERTDENQYDLVLSHHKTRYPLPGNEWLCPYLDQGGEKALSVCRYNRIAVSQPSSAYLYTSQR